MEEKKKKCGKFAPIIVRIADDTEIIEDSSCGHAERSIQGTRFAGRGPRRPRDRAGFDLGRLDLERTGESSTLG